MRNWHCLKSSWLPQVPQLIPLSYETHLVFDRKQSCNRPREPQEHAFFCFFTLLCFISCTQFHLHFLHFFSSPTFFQYLGFDFIVFVSVEHWKALVWVSLAAYIKLFIPSSLQVLVMSYTDKYCHLFCLYLFQLIRVTGNSCYFLP